MNTTVKYSIDPQNVARSLPMAPEELAPLLIGGMSGSGKSVFLHGLIRWVKETYAPSEAKILLMDPKLVEFAGYREDPHLFLPVVTDAATACAALETLTREKSPFKVFVFLDEYAGWSNNARFKDLIAQLAESGKRDGIYLFVATQRVTQDVLPQEFRSSFSDVAAFHVYNEDASRLLLGTTGAEKLPLRGEMLLSRNAGDIG